LDAGRRGVDKKECIDITGGDGDGVLKHHAPGLGTPHLDKHIDLDRGGKTDPIGGEVETRQRASKPGDDLLLASVVSSPESVSGDMD